MALKKLLIIEDNPKHLEEVKKFIDERVSAGADLDARFVSTLEEAKKALDAEQYDGIISDIFFPDREGAPPEPAIRFPSDSNDSQQEPWVEGVGGVKLVREAQARRIPFTLCTSTYHHGQKRAEFVTRWLRLKGVNFLVEAPREIGSGEAEHKDWRSAFVALAYLRSLIDHRLYENKNVESGALLMTTSSLWRKLYEQNPDRYKHFGPIEFSTNFLCDLYGNPLRQVLREIDYGVRKGKLYTIDPILIEILSGPAKGLVAYSSEAPTIAEVLEKTAEQDWFASEVLKVPWYDMKLGKIVGQKPWTDKARPAVERFVEAWEEDKLKADQAWREWLKFSTEGIEGTETELPRRRPR